MAINPFKYLPLYEKEVSASEEHVGVCGIQIFCPFVSALSKLPKLLRLHANNTLVSVNSKVRVSVIVTRFEQTNTFGFTYFVLMEYSTQLLQLKKGGLGAFC